MEKLELFWLSSPRSAGSKGPDPNRPLTIMPMPESDCGLPHLILVLGLRRVSFRCAKGVKWYIVGYVKNDVLVTIQLHSCQPGEHLQG